jgi:hypothetical protein
VCHIVADGGFEESRLYYTTPHAKKQAGNAGDHQHMLKKSEERFPDSVSSSFYQA